MEETTPDWPGPMSDNVPAIWFEDLAVGQVERFGSKLVERQEVIAFASAYDPQPFHLDDAAAAANPLFGRLAASGWHIAAMAMRMNVDFWRERGYAILIGLEVREMRWLRPVYPGDMLRCEEEVIETRSSRSQADRGIVSMRLTVRNQHDEPVMYRLSSMLMSRNSAAISSPPDQFQRDSSRLS